MANNFFEHIIHHFDRPFQNPVLVFALILFIILISPILLRKLKIPGIIGLIISGVIVGPHGINLIEQNSAVTLFSTIGLLYIMFIAGLELDLKEFQLNKNKSIVFGFLTFALPLIIGFPVCYFILGYGFTASLLISSMFSTHTMVSYPIVSKFGISKNQAVAITVGGTILTDTAVLILLAIILSSNEGGLTLMFWINLIASLTAFSGIMFFLIPRITLWFFKTLESEKTSHYIFVMAVVFFAAFLAELAGVEAIIGAFVAGLALNKLIPYTSALMNRIEFIGNSIFIPFFLISVGMLVDIGVLLNGPAAIIVALTLTIVALLGKWFAAYVTRYLFRYTSDQRKLIFGLSSSHAAATLAVITVGFKTNIIDENVLNGTILLILITCLVASFVTENAARRILTSEADEPLTLKPEITEEQIMIPVANLKNMETMLEFASFIKNKKSSNPISILSIVPNNDESEANLAKARNNLQSLVKIAAANETDVNIIATIDHNIAGGIIRTSREISADTIIVGWPRVTGLLERFIETKTDSIVSRTSKSVFLCHFEFPLAAHKRLVVTCPPLAELEKGFSIWLNKLIQIAKELSCKIYFYCNQKTKESITETFKVLKFSQSSEFSNDFDLYNLQLLHDIVLDEDLLIYVSARKASASYDSYLDNIEEKLEKSFNSYSRIVIYPQTYAIDSKYTEYGEISSKPLNQSLETFQKIGKDISNLLKRDSNKNH